MLLREIGTWSKSINMDRVSGLIKTLTTKTAVRLTMDCKITG